MLALMWAKTASGSAIVDFCCKDSRWLRSIQIQMYGRSSAQQPTQSENGQQGRTEANFENAQSLHPLYK